MASLQAWLDRQARGGPSRDDPRYRANTSAAAIAAGCGYWAVVPPLVGMRRIRNDVWLDFVEGGLKPTLREPAYRKALIEAMRLQPHVLFPINISYSVIPGFNYALRWTLLDFLQPQLSPTLDGKFERFISTWLVTIGAFTAADVPFLFMKRVVCTARPIEVMLQQEGRASNIFNQYRELRARNQITGLFNGWRRSMMRALYMWGPANAVHEVAKHHWRGGPDRFSNQFFGAVLGAFVGSFINGTREFLFERPIREWNYDKFQETIFKKARNIPLKGVAAARYNMQGMTYAEVVLNVIGAYKLHYRPWAITLNLVLFDQLQMMAHKWQWGVRAWNWPYTIIPDGMRKLHEIIAWLPKPPPPAAT